METAKWKERLVVDRVIGQKLISYKNKSQSYLILRLSHCHGFKMNKSYVYYCIGVTLHFDEISKFIKLRLHLCFRRND